MKIEEILSVQKFWYTAFGVWDPTSQRWFYKVYAFIINLILIFGFTFFMSMYVFYVKEFEDLASFLYLYLTILAFLVKLINFVVRQKTIQSLLQDIQNELDYCDPEEIEMIASQQIKIIKVINTMYYSVAMCCLSIAYITPLFSVDRSFPLPSYYPFDWKSNDVIYGLLILFQVLGSSSICVVNASLDTLMSTQMCILGFLFEILGAKLENLGSRIVKYSSSVDVESEKLKACMDFHKRILRCTDMFQMEYSLVIFIQFSISSTVICVTAYHVSIISPNENFLKFFVPFFYIMTLFVQLGLPCYYGNEIILKSEKLQDKIFSALWVPESQRFQKMMVIFMERLKRPVQINAGRLFGVSLQTLSSVRN